MKLKELEKVIAAIDTHIQVLQLAKAKLQAQQVKAPARKPRARPTEVAKSA